MWELFGVNKILTGVLMALLVCTLTIMGAENIIAFSEIICLPMIVITVIGRHKINAYAYRVQTSGK